MCQCPITVPPVSTASCFGGFSSHALRRSCPPAQCSLCTERERAASRSVKGRRFALSHQKPIPTCAHLPPSSSSFLTNKVFLCVDEARYAVFLACGSSQVWNTAGCTQTALCSLRRNKALVSQSFSSIKGSPGGTEMLQGQRLKRYSTSQKAQTRPPRRQNRDGLGPATDRYRTSNEFSSAKSPHQLPSLGGRTRSTSESSKDTRSCRVWTDNDEAQTPDVASSSVQGKQQGQLRARALGRRHLPSRKWLRAQRLGRLFLHLATVFSRRAG